ncbi:MAG: Unknown protein [uncultured Thiotrichaceae bacterium]|uniref:Uncharacterized protein n=1 Tax=uncultured Thiotrichaceae bacterium TaxID=298394 RepID=A0A6S6TXI8_9GAMM|nr:MAG: Unknown protein [uncultured Thiotrichaceae bacterium]
MSYNKILMLVAGLVVTALTSSNAYAVNCGISYYCYRSMTPGPAPEQGSAALARRTAAASNRLSRVASNNRRAQPAGANRAATPRATPRTLQQRQAEARRREQQQQQQLAARRRQAQQQEQQRLAQVRRQQQQRAAANRPQPTNARERLIAQQRAAYQAQQRAAQQRTAQQRAAQQRATQQQAAAAQQRRAQQQAAANRPAAPTPARPSVLTTASQQSCQTITQKITELNRQAVLRSKEGKNDQAQRLFKAVEQLKKEATGKQCPGV